MYNIILTQCRGRKPEIVQDVYEGSMTAVRCGVGVTGEFQVEVGLHQGLALSPFFFAIEMNVLTDEVRQEFKDNCLCE